MSSAERAAPADAQAELAAAREEIEQLDRELVALVARRVAIARRVGTLKHRLGMTTLDPEREASVVRRAAELARDAALDVEELRHLFWCVVGLSRRAQMEQE